MSTNMVKDIFEFHEKFKVHETIDKMDKKKLKDYLRFRCDMIKEEVKELEDAIEHEDPEGIVDALADITVFTIGTADAFAINSQLSWDAVMKSNFAKVTGIKDERPNPFGFPDLIKPKDWVGPSHKGNHGLLESLYK